MFPNEDKNGTRLQTIVLKQYETPERNGMDNPLNIGLIRHSRGILQVQKNLSSDPKLPVTIGLSFVRL